LILENREPMTKTGATVFIVDDDPSVRKALLRLIRSSGWHGEAFASAEEFLARPAFSGIGCLILDVRMPGMMGPDLLDVMSAHNISLPVIFLSGHTDIPAGVDACNEGRANFLVKPVESKVLLQTIRHALERHSAAQNYHTTGGKTF
jgi:FixJ family two-component response regulator